MKEDIEKQKRQEEIERDWLKAHGLEYNDFTKQFAPVIVEAWGKPDKINKDMKYKIIGQGDDAYEYSFDNINGVWSFLYSILDNIDKGDFDTTPMFDIEDDKITLITPTQTYSCNGWHWYEKEHKELLMPDGESFYSKCSKLYN